ncbi:MAG: J domain-containing protein [Pseudobdellovibrionaceae bacterium]|nr:J domain-containing protein [Pseudobdellovibrionaceae bacterium]
MPNTQNIQPTRKPHIPSPPLLGTLLFGIITICITICILSPSSGTAGTSQKPSQKPLPSSPHQPPRPCAQVFFLPLPEGFDKKPPLDHIKEQVTIEVNPDHHFGSQFIQSIYIEGALVRVEIFPNGNPFYKRGQTSNSGNTGLLSLNNPNSNNNHPIPLNQPHAPLTDHTSLRATLTKIYGNQLDEQTIDYLVELGAQNSEVLQIILHNRPVTELTKLTNPILLSNLGIERFFWFIPEELSELVPARILDIHVGFVTLETHPDGTPKTIDHVASLLVEYFIPPHRHSNPHHYRETVVKTLNPTELKSVTVSETHHRQAAFEAFLDGLSLVELQNQRMMALFKLPLFGFNFPFRGLGFDISRPISPQAILHNNSHLVIMKEILDHWGRIDFLLNEAERNTKYPNYIDVFSRLDPAFVLEQFGPHSPTIKPRQPRFFWVVTEDGFLKIVPAPQEGNNLSPSIFRLASGRKIVAGGAFVANKDKTLTVTLNGNFYQWAGSMYGDFAFLKNNPHLVQFLTEVFFNQTGYRMESIYADPLRSYRLSHDREEESTQFSHRYSFDTLNFDTFNWFTDKKKFNQGNGGNDSSFSSKTKSRQKPNKPNQKSGNNPYTTVTFWDPNKSSDPPMDLAQYARQLRISERDSGTQLRWAYYVLGLPDSAKYAKIKLRYRELSQKFHPDRNPSPQALETMKLINMAFDIIRRHFIRE